MRRRLATIVAPLALVPALAGCGSSSSSSNTTPSKTHSSSLKVNKRPNFAPATGPVRAGTVQIAYRNIAIAPDTLKVKVGSTLRWTNHDDIVHNVTSVDGPQKLASQDFGEGGTFELKVTSPGTIHYVCTIHPTTMNGTIEVVGG